MHDESKREIGTEIFFRLSWARFGANPVMRCRSAVAALQSTLEVRFKKLRGTLELGFNVIRCEDDFAGELA